MILALITALSISCDPPADDVTLKASISKSDTQLIIQNNDSFDWINVEIKINGDYAYKISEIGSLTTAYVGFLNFTANDGKIFDPFAYKVQDITISCKADNKYGFVSAKFN